MADRALQVTGPRYKSWKDNGTVNSGGLIYFYEAGTTDPKDTYLDAEATTANANPVVLDTRGEAAIYGQGAYKIVEKDSDEVQLGDAMDGVLLPEITDDALGLLNDATTTEMRTTLGLGTAAVLDVGVAASKVVQFTAAAKYPAADGSLITNIAAGAAALPRGYLSGFTMSRSANQTISIVAGSCRDSTHTANMNLASTYTKEIDEAWTAGSAGGCLDAGSIAASTWYHMYAIYNSSTSTTDLLLSKSASSPSLTKPSGYAYFRRIGSILTDGDAYITDFTQFGDEFLWKDPPADFIQSSDGYIGTTASAITLSVPLGIQTRAIITGSGGHGTSASAIYISSTDMDDEAPTGDTVPPFGQLIIQTSNKRYAIGQVHVRTSTTSTIRARASVANTSFDCCTLGWFDSRGK